MRKNNGLLLAVLALIVGVGACEEGKIGGGSCKNPIAPSCGNGNGNGNGNGGAVAQIEHVEVSVPSGTGTVLEYGQSVTVTFWVSLDLPASEYVSIHLCFSAERDTLTYGCVSASSKTVADWRRDNPVRNSNNSPGLQAGYPLDIRYIHILVFRGQDMRRIRPGSPVPEDTLTREAKEWTATWLPKPG